MNVWVRTGGWVALRCGRLDGETNVYMEVRMGQKISMKTPAFA